MKTIELIYILLGVLLNKTFLVTFKEVPNCFKVTKRLWFGWFTYKLVSQNILK